MVRSFFLNLLTSFNVGSMEKKTIEDNNSSAKSHGRLWELVNIWGN